MQHANAAVDEARRAEFFRKGGRVRHLVKGKRWLLLSRCVHLNGRTSLVHDLIGRGGSPDRRCRSGGLLFDQLIAGAFGCVRGGDVNGSKPLERRFDDEDVHLREFCR
jgi:hypothetical protein